MAKAEQAYHRRDRDVTARILAEPTRAVDWGSAVIGGATMNLNGAVMTLARWEARQAVKRELYAQVIKLQSVESREIT
ncbi:MAG: hypothetical protein WA760_09640, partial [Pseudolabrys sp.]